VGTLLAKVINRRALRRLGLLAWPNIWAQRLVVPELVGLLKRQLWQNWLWTLNHPKKLQQMSEQLSAIRGESGAAQN
jgi:lipid-A-disaccharide synthase